MTDTPLPEVANTGVTDPAPIAGLSSGQLTQLRFDYAWKWFAFHADQRTKVFNFMIISVGILANAIVVAVQNQRFDIGIFLSGVGAALSFFYMLLDGRNKMLVHLGEKVLVQLERDVIFKNIDNILTRGSAVYAGTENFVKDTHFGILWRQDQDTLRRRPPKWFERRLYHPVFDLIRGLFSGQHRVLFRLIAFVLFVGFAWSGFYIDRNRAAMSKPTPARLEHYLLRIQGAKLGPDGVTIIISRDGK